MPRRQSPPSNEVARRLWAVQRLMGMDPEEFGTLTRFAQRIHRLPSDVSATMRSGHITWSFALDVVKAESRVTVEWLVQGRSGNIASGVLRELEGFMPKGQPSA